MKKTTKTTTTMMRGAFATLLVLVATGCGDDGKKAPAVEPGFPVTEVEAGTCGGMSADDARSTRFVAVRCEDSHESEVAGTYALSGDEYPGSSALRLDTQLACQPIFERYVGTRYWDSRFELKAIAPSPSAWSMGERTVVCLVVDKDGEPLEEVARGSGR